jgi:branched-chain amino acid transport system permease protein
MRHGSANATMVRRHGDDIVIFRDRATKIALALLLVALVLAPLRMSAFQLSVAVYAGIAAIGALGLNLLSGFTGQVSLGHAAFLGTGAYIAAYVGGDLGLPLAAWVPAAALGGAIVGGVIGPFALRLRGNYLAIVTLGLVFLAQHVFESWTSVTGGLNGRSVSAPVAIGPIDFAAPEAFGRTFSRDQGYYWLVLLAVALVALTMKNLVRSRTGRALQAVRDRDLAAEAIGVRIARYKVLAFVLSSSLAAVAGALYGSYQRFVSPGEFTLILSIQYVAMVIIGGAGTVFGPILGAFFVTTVPRIIEELSGVLPGVTTDSSGGAITVFSLNQAIFGLLVIGFLVLEPRGLAALWLRLRAYFRSWPFSY